MSGLKEKHRLMEQRMEALRREADRRLQKAMDEVRILIEYAPEALFFSLAIPTVLLILTGKLIYTYLAR